MTRQVILESLYGISGFVTFFAFYPTIRDLWQGIPSANIQTYALWTITTLIVFLYASLINGDPLFVFVVGLQLFACLSVLILALRLKSKKI